VNRRLSNAAGAFLFVCALACPASARADLIPWTYSWSPSSSTVAATSGPGGITLTNEPLVAAQGDSDVVATSLRTFASGPSVFSAAAYSLTMQLTDTLSGQSGTLTFTGAFSGTLSSGSSKITNAFTGLTTQTLTLGGNTYTVTLDQYLHPGSPTASNPGGIGGSVTVVGDSVGHPSSVPEPSSLLLAGLGCSGLLALRFRRRRRPAASPAA